MSNLGDDRSGFGRHECAETLELSDAQKITDAEGQIADAERTIADAEDTIADLEHERPDQSPPSDSGALGVDRWRADREDARAKQVQHAAERPSAEPQETKIALDRFDVAEERDLAAGARDRASAARDEAAATRDRRPPERGFAPALVARKRAADDRGHSAGDRVHSGLDRHETRVDRETLRSALTEAQVDQLTGAYQRAIGLVELQAELDRADRSGDVLTLAFIDVDDLKVRNDQDGHAAGDALLQDVAASMTERLRSYDPLVRYGGDEFICALADADLNAARARFDDIAATLRERDPHASFSVGFAVFEPGETLEELIARGDASLYEAKHQRRARR